MMDRRGLAINPIFSRHGLSWPLKNRRGTQNGSPCRLGLGIINMLTGVEDQGLPLPTANATGDELFKMGLLYSTGQGGAPLDYVSAHMLFNLAAMRGSIEAKVYRKELSQEMAMEDVAEAQRQAREWLAHG